MCFRSEGITKFLEIGATLILLPSVPSTFRTDLVLWDNYLFQARFSEETDNRQTAYGLRVGRFYGRFGFATLCVCLVYAYIKSIAFI